MFYFKLECVYCVLCKIMITFNARTVNLKQDTQKFSYLLYDFFSHIGLTLFFGTQKDELVLS